MTFSGWFTDIFGIELNLEEFLSRQLSVVEEFGSLDEERLWNLQPNIADSFQIMERNNNQLPLSTTSTSIFSPC